MRANPLLPESNGIKVGEGRLHPFLEADAHQVHNPGRFPGAAFDNGIPNRYRNDYYFVVRPGVDFRLPSPKLEIGATAFVERQEYVRNDNFSSWQGGLGGNLHWNKQGPLQLRINQMLTRSAAPGNQTFVQRFDHWTESLGVGVDFIPGNGALKLTAEMNLFIDAYDNDSQIPPELLNNERYTPTVRAAWAFLPKTEIFVEGSGTFANFREQAAAINADSWIYSGSAGLNGIITPRISALAKVGFTGINTSGDGPTNITNNTVGAQLEATWDISPHSKWRVGGARTIEPTSVFLFATQWKGYTRFDQLIASRLNISLGAEYNHLSYGRSVSSLNGAGVFAGTNSTDDGRDERRDHVVQGSIALAYYVSDFITISIVDRVDFRRTNYQYPFSVNDGTTTPALPAEYITNDVFLRLGFRY